MQTQKDLGFGRGLLLGFSAYLIWGSFPLIISMLGFASPFEVVVWRIVFGCVAALLLITAMRGWPTLRATLRQPRQLSWIAVASVFIMINWQVYVIGVANHHIVETSLGYFINPLVTIVLAVLALGERLRPIQWVAVGFGALAVTVLTLDYGRLPWIAMSLAISFGIYGLAKNKLGGKVSAVNSFALESGMLLPLALVQGFIVSTITPLSFGTAGFWPTAGLIFFGFMTAIPLIMFGAAAKHLPLSYIGFMQYITPIIQFSLGVLVFHEAMPAARWVGFALVWAGLAILSFDLIRQQRRTKSA